MKVLLINPPLCVHEFPHLALPALKGYLKAKGIECDALDINVEVMDGIVSDGLEKVAHYFNERNISMTVEEVRRRFHQARQVFLSKDWNGKDERAQRLINTYLRIAGSNIFDVCFRPDSLQAIKDAYEEIDFENSPNRIIGQLREMAFDKIRQKDYGVVGISVPFTSQIFYAIMLGKAVKRAFPKCKVILGGPQISLFHNIIANYRPFRDSYDGLVYGQGEKALEGYIKAVGGEVGSLTTVPNLIYWEDEKLTINKEENVCTMEDIPLADFSDYPLDKYIYAKLPYQMSRGCYWGKCAFCSYRDYKKYDVRKAEQVRDHLEQLEGIYGRHMFQFIDDAIHPKLLSKLANLILDNGMNIRYDAYLRLDIGFTADLCKKLAKSGLKNVLFGMESANQRVLDLMQKGNTPEDILSVMKNMKNAGIQNILSCLIGFPTETEQEAWESIQFLKENREWYYWVYIVHFGMISDMRNDTDTYGIKNLRLDDLVRYDDTGFTALGYPYETSIGMTVDEAFSIIKKGREELGITIFEDNFFS